MNDKRERAVRLFDTVGEIDERFIAEAQAARPRRMSNRQVIVLVAAVMAVWILLIAIPANISKSDKDGMNDTPQATSGSITEILKSAETNACASTDPSLIDSQPKLIWRDCEDDSLYSVKLSKNDLENIMRMIPGGKAVGEGGTASPEVLVWISYGDGKVISPYLDLTPGNIGITLFDYSPELEPSAELTHYIKRTIEMLT